MKHTFKLIALTTFLQMCSCYGTMVTASVTQDIITTNMTTRVNMYVISDSQTYTTGGITFTYPTGLFTLPPLVQVAVQPSAPHPSTETFGAEITTNSATSTTITVYKVQFGVVSEAASGSVIVNLFAVADPV